MINKAAANPANCRNDIDIGVLQSYNRINKAAVNVSNCRNAREGDEMKVNKTIQKKRNDYFNRKELHSYLREENPELSESSFKVKLQEFLNKGEIARVGRNAYLFCDDDKGVYNYEYGDLAKKVANNIIIKYPKIDFRIFELVQLNELINHQIAHNTLFISVENNLGEFVFELLKDIYPGKVMIYPTSEEIHRYWSKGMMVIEKLTTESPRGAKQFWTTRIEKLLVDAVRDDYVRSNFSEAELPGIFENAFERYVIDESMLRRYAMRRTAEKKLLKMIAEETNIKLKIWGKY